MPSSTNRRRVEIDADVYDMLERHARWLHIPVAATATMLIREGLDRYERDITPGPRRELRDQPPLGSMDAAFVRRLREEAPIQQES